MSYKQLYFRAEAREKVLHGAAALADAVRGTLGPKAKCVLIQRKWGKPLVCNDGVTIAKEIELKDPEENLGALMLREAAEKTGELVGDGTTTATLLAYAIYAEGLRNVAAGASAIDLKRGLDRGLTVAVGAIRDLSRPVESRRERVQVATISGHNDRAIGEMVADAVEKVGREGVISVEEAKATETTLEVVEGMQFDRGFLSPYFITQPDKLEAVLQNARILIFDKHLAAINELIPLLEKISRANQPLLVIAEDIESEALALLVVNKVRGALSCAAVKAPGFGDRRKDLVQDLAVLTGGQVIGGELGQKLESVTLEQLGQARRIVINKESTTIIGGAGDHAAIEARCAEIRALEAQAKSEYDREKLEERLAKLSGGVAVIHAGAASEAEMRSKKEAFEDAINATKAAMAEGVVPGGGLTLLRATEALKTEAEACYGDERTGVLMLKRALEEPARQIAENSSADGGVVVEKMRAGTGSWGYDAARGEFVDLVEAGIIDPAKVVRTALENAVSVAGVLLLTEATLTEVEEPASSRGFNLRDEAA